MLSTLLLSKKLAVYYFTDNVAVSPGYELGRKNTEVYSILTDLKSAYRFHVHLKPWLESLNAMLFQKPRFPPVPGDVLRAPVFCGCCITGVTPPPGLMP